MAIPALLNVIHATAKHVRVKHGIAAFVVAYAVLLFAGSVRFFVSGQFFEEFSGMEVPSSKPA